MNVKNVLQSSGKKLSDKEQLEEFGRRLRQARQEMKMLEADFASRLEISDRFLKELETGHITPAFDLLHKLYTLYKISLNYLVEGDGEAFLSAGDLDELPMPDQRRQTLIDALEVRPRMLKK